MGSKMGIRDSLEDYKAAANKENEQFIEEFVSGQSIRAAQTQSV